MVDPTSDRWKTAMDLVPNTNFQVWGFHWTTKAVIDSQADRINEEIEKIVANVEVCGTSPLKPYFTFSLSGRDELNGPTIHERGSAMAKDRHWRRAYKIIAAFDEACQKNDVKGSLYPHIDWICDTPQSAIKIIEGAKAKTVVPAFCPTIGMPIKLLITWTPYCNTPNEKFTICSYDQWHLSRKGFSGCSFQ